MKGSWDEAVEHRKSALQHYVALNHLRSIAVHRSGLAHILRRQGKLDEAEIHYRKSITGWQEIGQLPAVAHQVECFAFIAVARGTMERAARLLGAARSARERLNAVSYDPREIEELKETMDQLAATMGEEERDRVMAEGSRLSLDAAVLLAVNEEAA